MESTGPHKLVMQEWIDLAPFEKLLNFTILEAKDGRAVLTMPFYFQYAQGMGLMHGGALVSLADTAVVMAIKSVLPPGTHFATISLETQFLKPVTQGIVTALAETVRASERIFKGSATIYTENDLPVMTFSSTFKIAQNSKV